jgi:hypothetical protein
MPNWVYTTMEVTGKSEDIKKFVEKASTPYTAFHKGIRTTNQDGTTSYDPDAFTEEVQKEKFMFWNFLRPAEEDLEYYFGKAVKPEDKDDPDATPEERMAKAMKFAGSGWYDWNIREWGCKWDASNSDYYSEPDYTQETTSVGIAFDTAWSIPEGAFRAIIQQHPELDFEFECEEETGWGAKFTSGDVEEGEQRSLITTEEWSEPSCHADYVNRGRDCWACDNGDEEDYYDDCPRPERDFYVVVTKTYRVKAVSAENAWNLAIENEDNLDDLAVVMEDETSTWVKDEDGSRAYPNFDKDEDEDGSE